MDLNSLILNNLKLADWWAWMYHQRNNRFDINELKSEARKLLVKAANSYQEEKGDFKNYANKVINNGLYSAFVEKYKAGKRSGSENQTSLDIKLDQAEDPQQQDFFEPDYYDVVAALGLSPDKISEISEIEQIVNQSLSQVSPSLKNIFMDWMNGFSFRELEQKYGVNFMTIRYKIQKELEKIKLGLDVSYGSQKTYYTAIASRNTIPGELPYRITYFLDYDSFSGSKDSVIVSAIWN
jgi:RNA polymerase sigma factor (sigma-70 family)